MHAFGVFTRFSSCLFKFKPKINVGRPLMQLAAFMPKPESSMEVEPTILPPYAVPTDAAIKRKVYIETYGCQMNANDTEIVRSILLKSNMFELVPSFNEKSLPDVALLMTCAIREGAESKIWSRVDALSAMARKAQTKLSIGILGCMARRLREDIVERRKSVDVVCGPDSYRDLPQLLQSAETGQPAINVMLSADETYADISPVRQDKSSKSAYVTIMRGCNNMCAFCIVPHVRGRERSRSMESILDEIRQLSSDGIREITLLGQNVNSYFDETSQDAQGKITIGMTPGFSTVYKTKTRSFRGSFAHLLEQASRIDSSIRIRFTSPHPKDFPAELLEVMQDRANICKQIHLPAQSGSNNVLNLMRRGYTREAYLDLVSTIRSRIPSVSLSSDFISGFCGETDADHKLTIDLIKTVEYDMAYMFAYSMRERTMAHRRYADDVPPEIKAERLAEVIRTFYSSVSKKVHAMIGNTYQILVDGHSKKSSQLLAGKTDGGRTVVFAVDRDVAAIGTKNPVPGNYVDVHIKSVEGHTPIGILVNTI